jgi:hypothetical protein
MGIKDGTADANSLVWKSIGKATELIKRIRTKKLGGSHGWNYLKYISVVFSSLKEGFMTFIEYSL